MGIKEIKLKIILFEFKKKVVDLTHAYSMGGWRGRGDPCVVYVCIHDAH